MVQAILTEIAIPLPHVLSAQIAGLLYQVGNGAILTRSVWLCQKRFWNNRRMCDKGGWTSDIHSWDLGDLLCWMFLETAECPESGKDHLGASLAQQQSLYKERLSGSKLSCCLSLTWVSIQYSRVSCVLGRETVMSKFKDEIYLKKKATTTPSLFWQTVET